MNHETKVLVGPQRATARPATLAPARALSHAGEHAAARLATATAGAVVDRPRRRQWLRAGTAASFAHAVSVDVKRVARLTRPLDEDLTAHVSTPSNWSFPSSHATSTTAAAIVFGPLLGRGTWLLPAMMAWSRMALGVHQPTDVLSGTLMGAAVGAFSERRRQECSR